jgi:hypothetical protein
MQAIETGVNGGEQNGGQAVFAPETPSARWLLAVPPSTILICVPFAADRRPHHSPGQFNERRGQYQVPLNGTVVDTLGLSSVRCQNIFIIIVKVDDAVTVNILTPVPGRGALRVTV